MNTIGNPRRSFHEAQQLPVSSRTTIVQHGQCHENHWMIARYPWAGAQLRRNCNKKHRPHR